MYIRRRISFIVYISYRIVYISYIYIVYTSVHTIPQRRRCARTGGGGSNAAAPPRRAALPSPQPGVVYIRFICIQYGRYVVYGDASVYKIVYIGMFSVHWYVHIYDSGGFICIQNGIYVVYGDGDALVYLIVYIGMLVHYRSTVCSTWYTNKCEHFWW